MASTKSATNPGINREPNPNRSSPDSAKERSSQSLQLHFGVVESADLLPGSSDLGVEYQCRRERHSASGFGPQKLDPLRKPRSRTTDRGHPLHSRNLPSPADRYPRLSRFHTARFS